MKHFKNSLLLFVFIFTSGGAHAARFENIADKDVLLNLRQDKALEALPVRLNLVSWNIEKAKQKQRWRQDFSILAKESDLFLLQEGMADNYLPAVLAQTSLPEWWMAQAWKNSDGHSTGVITGSKSKSLTQGFLRSPDSEPIANTPKMSLVQTYALQNGEKLLLVNVHGINFVLNVAFRRQMTEILKLIDRAMSENSNLKVLVVGDLNTWNLSRLNFISKELNFRGFAHVVFQQDRRNLKLDHVFVRGCSIETAVLHSSIKTSDHAPIEVGLDCGKETGIGPSVDSSHYFNQDSN